MQITRFRLLITALWVGVAGSSSHALTIAWGNDLASNVLQESDSTILGSAFKFEIGTFANHSGGQPGTAIDPSGFAYSTWTTAWKPIDFAEDGDGWVPATRIFSKEADVVETPAGSDLGQTNEITGSGDFFADPQYDPGEFPGGEKIYLWVHNGTVLGGSDATQAALVTSNGWRLPDFETHTFPLAIDLADATAAVMGSLTIKDVDLRLAAVPEPAVPLLLLVGVGGIAMASRRRSTACSRKT